MLSKIKKKGKRSRNAVKIKGAITKTSQQFYTDKQELIKPCRESIAEYAAIKQ